MSHYTMLVIADSEENVREVLTPYYEYGCSSHMDEKVKPYLKFNDCTEELREDWETRSMPMVVEPIKPLEDWRAHLFSKYDDRYRVLGTLASEYEVPEEFGRIDIPYKVFFPTFKSYADDSGEYEYREELDAYGYLHNPNSKWDWFTIGGRWSGKLILKDGSTANYASVGDIDWEAMKKDDINKVWLSWKKYLSTCHPLHILWYTGIGSMFTIIYRPLLKVKRSWAFKLRDAFWKIEKKMPRPKGVDWHGADPDMGMNISCGEMPWTCYTRRTGPYTWGMVTSNGQWLEKATMGWFGCSYNDQGRRFRKAYFKELESLSDDQMVYVVDCHI